MWTMRKEFLEPEPFTVETASVVERDNISNIGREALAGIQPKVDIPK